MQIIGMPPRDGLPDVLVCPRCKGLIATTPDGILSCRHCDLTFPQRFQGQIDLRIPAHQLLDALPRAEAAYRRNQRGILPTLRRRYRWAKRRALTTWFGFGNEVECCFCGWTGRRFLPAGQSQLPNRLCPKCGSIERYRMLRIYLERQMASLRKPIRLLDLAPKECFSGFCTSHPDIAYLSSDLVSAKAVLLSDLTQMSVATAGLDVIVCLHVMEHVPDDRAAYGEMYRMLAPGGFALVMVPLRDQGTFEDRDARPEDFERLYGQYDHVRHYGMDVVARMEAAGFDVDTIDVMLAFDIATLDRYALRGHDRYLFRLNKRES